MPDPQSACDKLFQQFRCREISRHVYVNELDQLYETLPDSVRKKVDRRKDQRSLGEFALAIYDNTVRETFLVGSWAESLGRGDVTLSDLGLDNGGRLVLDARGENRKCDYALSTKIGEYSLEVKFGPTQRFVTYKVADLHNYASRSDAWVLTIVGNTMMIGPNGDPDSDRPLEVPPGLKWFIMGHAEILGILAQGQHGHHKGFGGKPTVRLYSNQFSSVIRLRSWKSQPALV